MGVSGSKDKGEHTTSSSSSSSKCNWQKVSKDQAGFLAPEKQRLGGLIKVLHDNHKGYDVWINEDTREVALSNGEPKGDYLSGASPMLGQVKVESNVKDPRLWATLRTMAQNHDDTGNYTKYWGVRQ